LKPKKTLTFRRTLTIIPSMHYELPLCRSLEVPLSLTRKCPWTSRAIAISILALGITCPFPVHASGPASTE
jgi:hypothetical protein